MNPHKEISKNSKNAFSLSVKVGMRVLKSSIYIPHPSPLPKGEGIVRDSLQSKGIKNLTGSFKEQSGVVLVVSLIMLLLLTLIGVSGMQSTILEEKMAGNMRDRNLAFQAAEAALRDAEREIYNHTRIPSGYTNFTPDCGKATPAVSDDGLCYNGPVGYPAASPVWETADILLTAPSVEYGVVTGAFKIGDKNGDGDVDDANEKPSLSAQPRYIIEALKQPPNHICDGTNPCYRITARAQGANPTTVVILQSVYKPD